MSEQLTIALTPEVSDDGSPEERATFGMFVMRTNNQALTEGFDYYLNGYREGPLVSGYPIAEWFAWNWWRLRWEPRSTTNQWQMAHHMPSVGCGYVWPNITIFSDGLRTAIIASPSTRPDAKPFRYVGAIPVVLPSMSFETAVDSFVGSMVAHLNDRRLAETNLHRLWSDVLHERSDPELAKYRRLEAHLGRDPDAAEDEAISQLLIDAGVLGVSAIEEVAADAVRSGTIVTASELEQIAQEQGFDAAPGDVLRLSSTSEITFGPDVPAWVVGERAARAVRVQQRLGADPIPDVLLANLAGTDVASLRPPAASDLPLSFVLNEHGDSSAKVVLRSKWSTGRRFDLARLLGDRLIIGEAPLAPATRAYTYRQKIQRAFAAELLSPFDAVDDMLDGDYSQDNQQDVAGHFEVSPMTINTMLMNHGRVDRESADLDGGVYAA